MNKVALVALLLALAASLRIGSLSCCPTTYVYDEDTLTCVCPFNAAYKTADGRCVACSAPARWDNQTLTCEKCRKDQTEDEKGECVCPKTLPFNNGTACAPCPYELPIWNGYKCVACPPATNYDVNSKTCTVCPEGLIYSKSARTCEIQQ